MAETFTDVVSKFDIAIEGLATVTDGPFEEDNVGLHEAYVEFAVDHRAKMLEVQEHGTSLSGNVQAGAVEISATDSRAAADYGELGVSVEQESVIAEGNREYVSRHLNEHIDERYVPEESPGDNE